MAEKGERGLGRMAEPLEIAAAVENLLGGGTQSLKGKRVLVTSGPTHEPIDPVRYIANRSSGKQGHAIAAAAAAAGAEVTLVSGPVNLPDPPGVSVMHVESARDMLKAVERALPADVAIFAAAVADWRVANAGEQKIKKKAGQAAPELSLTENPDILSTIAHRKTQRPTLVIGFAAETENVAANAKEKLDAQRLRLDSGERRVAANRHHGRRSQHDSAGDRQGHRALAAAVEGRSSEMLIERIAKTITK